MSGEARNTDHCGVDKGLAAMFMRMSPEERLRASDNAFRAISTSFASISISERSSRDSDCKASRSSLSSGIQPAMTKRTGSS